MKFKFTALFLVASLLSACGGGGGGGGGGGKSSNTNNLTGSSVAATNSSTNQTSSSVVAASFTANAGDDITINEGEKVELDAKVKVVNQASFKSNTANGTYELIGSSTKSSDIVGIKWAQLEGVKTGFSFSGTPSEKFSFIAPDTGTADTLQIVYELTLTNAAGKTATDRVTITVKRVNEAPLADAGVDQTVESGTTISLTAAGSEDPDGEITSYSWVQIAGDAVDLIDADKATASFVAPDINEAATYEFELTVSDKDEATAKDSVVVTITPKDAPLVNIYFPTPVGVYKESTISVFGHAEAVAGNLHKIEVSAGSDFVAVDKIEDNGEWRIDNISVPATETFEVVVKVTDSLGKTNIKKSSLKKSGAQGTGQSWSKMIALGVDNSNQRILAFAKGLFLSDLRVFPIDLKTGNRGNDISNFNKSSQGPQDSAISYAKYDQFTSTFHYTVSPANRLNPLQLSEINVATGNRRLIVENYLELISSSATDFTNPAGIAYYDGEVFVADNKEGRIIRTAVDTGTKSFVIEASGIVDLALDPSVPNMLFALPYGMKTDVANLKLDSIAEGFSVISDFSDDSQGPAIRYAQHLEVDLSLNKFLLVDGDNQLFEADATSGLRSKIDSVLVSGKGYDHQRNLFYYNDPEKNAIYVLDPVSKHKVMISGSVD